MDKVYRLIERLYGVSSCLEYLAPPDTLGERVVKGIRQSIAEIAEGILVETVNRDAVWWRQHEVEFRSIGRYDQADVARQNADQIESLNVHQPPRHWYSLCRRDSDDPRNWNPFERLRT